MKDYLIKTTGEKIEIKPANGEQYTLEELQKYVGGYFSTLDIPGNKRLVFNEEGELLNMKINNEASKLARSNNRFLDLLLGDVVLINLRN